LGQCVHAPGTIEAIALARSAAFLAMTTPSPSTNSQAAPSASGVEHYENFPVATWLCPAHLRAPIAAIYWFARTADDLADEGNASFAERLQSLATYRADLNAIAQGQAPGPRWTGVFTALQTQIKLHQLPLHLLHNLLNAFEQDVRYTQAARWYESEAELLHYCQHSANPIGRLLLHLYGVADESALRQSDAICSALQLINFWQDLSQDIPRGRYYLPLHALAAQGLTTQDILSLQDTPNTINLIAAYAHSARAMMLKGIELPKTVRRSMPGFNGWRAALELRCVIHGGLRVLEKIAANGHRQLQHRPKLGKWDALVVLTKALRQSAA
jgi:hydroxysqualene synthase